MTTTPTLYVNSAPELCRTELKKGDYVLATKYSDGDPNDHWCVGYYEEPYMDRSIVVDDDGVCFRSNGFRRCEQITSDEGSWLLSNIPRDPYHGSTVNIWDLLYEHRKQAFRPATHDELIAAMPRCGTCGYCDDEHHISSFDGSDDATTILFCSLDERETWASHSCTEHKERV